jgi:hypothetical protein
VCVQQKRKKKKPKEGGVVSAALSRLANDHLSNRSVKQTGFLVYKHTPRHREKRDNLVLYILYIYKSFSCFHLVVESRQVTFFLDKTKQKLLLRLEAIVHGKMCV